ncbi:tyrosine-type recombinase/integrase [Amaricoccus macauensis]|uniref:tyrosine-type recombinase/integrase n=1 Tax=Amaricoccus macauensis TaxID=57001 RepID=UPI003C7AB69B
MPPRPSLSRPPRSNRLAGVDALVAILPQAQAERLAGVLGAEDIATLRHVARKGAGANSLRALGSDLGYLEAWCRTATGAPLPWPATEALALKFVAHHLWDPEEHARDPNHGMPSEVAGALRAGGFLRTAGPHAPATVRRRLSSWATLHTWRGLDHPLGAPALRKTLRLATRAAGRPAAPHSRQAITRDILLRLLTPLDAMAARPHTPGERRADAARLTALRDRAILSLGFGSGGRRRSEITGLRLAQVEWVFAEGTLRGRLPPAPPHGCLLHLGRTKTHDAVEDRTVGAMGRPATDLLHWLRAGAIRRGALFRKVDQWGNVSADALTPQAVNQIVKRRAAEAGLDPAQVSAHGLRSGYMTTAVTDGLSLPEAMAQSTHRSVAQAARYFDAANARTGKAAALLRTPDQ